MKRPSVGVGVIVVRDTKVLLGKRKNSHGDGDWNFPGGHLEWGESIIECAQREVMEETGLIVVPYMYGPFTNDIFEKEGKHYLTAFVIAHSEVGTPQVLEPQKCDQWGWFEWHQLPEPLFLPIIHLREMEFSPFRWSGCRVI